MTDTDYKDRAEKAEADVAFLVESVEKHVAAGIRLGERAEKAEGERDAALFDKAVAGGKVRVAEDRAEKAEAALRSIKWRSIDKDNMEFAATITYSQMDEIRALAGDKP